jgi:hypothetical protein
MPEPATAAGPQTEAGKRLLRDYFEAGEQAEARTLVAAIEEEARAQVETKARQVESVGAMVNRWSGHEELGHIVTLDDPLGEGPICRECSEDWPCPFVQGWRAAFWGSSPREGSE